MTIAEIQSELQSLPAEQQNRIAAFLTVLRMKREGEFSPISGRVEEQSPESWIDWEDAKEELGLPKDPAAE